MNIELIQRTDTPGETNLSMSQSILILRIWILLRKIRHSILYEIKLERFLLKISTREIKQRKFRSSNFLKHDYVGQIKSFAIVIDNFTSQLIVKRSLHGEIVECFNLSWNSTWHGSLSWYNRTNYPRLTQNEKSSISLCHPSTKEWTMSETLCRENLAKFRDDSQRLCDIITGDNT